MSKRVHAVLCLLFWTLGLLSAHFLHAQQYRITVGGIPVNCSYPDGRPVAFFSDPTLNDVGMTTQRGITLNPTVLATMSVHLRLFWVGHECGHAHVPTSVEKEADCWSAKTGVRQGWFDASDADELGREMAQNPGDNSHPPGPERVANVEACMGKASSNSPNDDKDSQPRRRAADSGIPPGMVRGVPPVKSPPLKDDPNPMNRNEVEMCKDLRQIVSSAATNFIDLSEGHRTDHTNFTSLRLPMATSCFVFSETPGYVCEFPKSYRDKLISSIGACFPDADKSGGGALTSFFLKSPGDSMLEVFTDKDVRFQVDSSKK